MNEWPPWFVEWAERRKGAKTLEDLARFSVEFEEKLVRHRAGQER